MARVVDVLLYCRCRPHRIYFVRGIIYTVVQPTPPAHDDTTPGSSACETSVRRKTTAHELLGAAAFACSSSPCSASAPRDANTPPLLRTALSTIVDYKGFRTAVTAALPVSDMTKVPPRDFERQMIGSHCMKRLRDASLRSMFATQLQFEPAQTTPH